MTLMSMTDATFVTGPTGSLTITLPCVSNRLTIRVIFNLISAD